MPKIIENLPEKLLAEARRQISEAGYDALTIRTVAKSCGIATGTVYNYFPSKDTLIAGVLAEDWMGSLERIRTAAEHSSIDPALDAIYRELTRFRERYSDLFRNASVRMPAPPRQYHEILRSQLSGILLPHCPDAFTADFIAEAMITWTSTGIPLPQLKAVIEKNVRKAP